ncbi:hypothetical protein N9112_02315 [bacterium]|jgi:hypothetical protein|nr:hypothetical protein [bacterium]
MKKYLVLFAFIIIQGCSSGGGDSTSPTDPNTVFQLFPTGYFTAGYTSTINYTGTDTAGSTYTGTVSKQTQAESTFLGVPAIPILYQIQITNTATGAFASGTSTEYFSTLATDRHYLGYSSNTTTTVSATTSPIPQTAKIGDFGIIGTYTDNAGNVDIQSWRIDDGGNGTANGVLLSNETDQFGNPTSSSVETTNIDASGNRLSEKLVIYYADSGITVTLNSN